MPSQYRPESVKDLFNEALYYGLEFGERRPDVRHGDWWVWFGLPIASDDEHMRSLPEDIREAWRHFGAEDRERFVLRALWDSNDVMNTWVVEKHHFAPGSTYADVAKLLYAEIGRKSPIAEFVGTLGTQRAFDMVMNGQYLDTVVSHLRQRGIEFGPGLADAEVDAIERRCAFRFPPDLRAFLQHAHPLGRPTVPAGVIVVGGPFPDWRNVPDDYIQQRFESILSGIFFDIDKNGFWHPEWGTKPADFADACDVARQELADAPTLIPVFAHRFIPSEPLLAGNPVFSLHQTDIIYYGFHLAHYFQREFGVPLPPWAASLPRTIRVWSESLNWRDDEYQLFART